MKNNVIVTIVIAIIFGAVGFFAGMKYQQGRRASFGNQFLNRQTSRQAVVNGQNNRTGFRPVNGEIINQEDKSITVKLQDGSSKIVFLSDTTTITKSSGAKKTDLTVGEKVAVFGLENSDGSVTAQNIQLNPSLRNQDDNPLKQTK